MGQRSKFYIPLLLATGFAYFIAGKLALLVALPPGIATPVWPPSGISLAAIVIGGIRLWPGIWIGSILVNIGPLLARSEIGDGTAVLLAVTIATGSTIQAVGGGLLIERICGKTELFQNVHNVFAFAGIESLLCLVAPSVGVTAMHLAGIVPANLVSRNWWTWWTGDLMGALVFTPLVMVWFKDRRNRWRSWVVQEAAALVLIIVLLNQLAFGVPIDGWQLVFPVPFILTPAILWAAFRFGQREVTFVILLVSAGVIWGTVEQRGPFGGQPIHQALLLAQAFLGILALIGLTLSAAFTERHQIEMALRQATEELEDRVQERTADLVEANAERIRAERKFRGILESAPDPMVIVNEQGEIVLVNAETERVFGFHREELLGQAVEMLVPELFRDQHPASRTKYAVARPTLPIGAGLDLYGLRKNGTEFPVEISLSPIRTEEGVLLSSSIRDITWRKETERRLRQAERLAGIGEMISGLAHESRNALQRSQSCLEMLQREVESRPKALDLVARIQNAQDHLHGLYEAVRNYAAPIQLNLKRYHLGTLLQQAWDEATANRADRNPLLRSKVDDVDLYCWVDPKLMGQVLCNVISNSLQACVEQPVIDVFWNDEMIEQKPGLKMILHDNGPGLSAEQKAKIFNPFYTTKTHGTGLGMAITKRIVESHCGKIEVGDQLATGTQIHITLLRNPLNRESTEVLSEAMAK